MAREMAEWPSKRGPTTKTMASDRCKGDTAPWRWDYGMISRNLDGIWEMSVKRMKPLASIILTTQAAAMCLASSLMAQPQWYVCTAWGGSHTGRYTFRIDAENCSVFWKELNTGLKIQSCKPPRIMALKPFAANRDFVVEFNLSTGGFADYANGRADRGSCRPVAYWSKPR